jgi:bacterioferritin-associated ferredoxin
MKDCSFSTSTGTYCTVCEREAARVILLELAKTVVDRSSSNITVKGAN